MIEYLTYTKGKIYPKGGDYTFTKIDELFKIVKYLTPKIEGKWIVNLDRLSLEDCMELLDSKFPMNHLNINLYLKRDTISLLKLNRPEINLETQTNWEKYLIMIGQFPKVIERKASSELYKRASGDLEVIRQVLDKLEEVEESIITLKEIKEMIRDIEDILYPRDLILTILLSNKRTLPAKGSRLSKFKYRKVETVYERVVSHMGERITFFAIRRLLRRLCEDKWKSLRGKSSDNEEIVKYISIYEIYAYLILFESSQPEQLYCILLKEKDYNDSLWKEACHFNE